ncbi:MAG: cytochrome c [Maribacter sp.]|uniref:c-type cytochrome n=1 Tax=Maribacter sp. TaxID=1897614 RepID=UPI003C74350D
MKYFFSLYLLGVLCVGILLQDTALKESIQRGSEIYADFCITCHMPQGEGVAFTFPPLAQSDYLLQNREASIRGIKYGNDGEMIVNGVTYNNTMAPMGLEDAEVADVMNYILNSWGNSSIEIVTIEEVEAIGK